MTPRILVNARFVHQPFTGVQRYGLEITRRLEGRIRPIAPARGLRGVGGHLWEQIVLPREVGREDLLWSPGNTGPLTVSNQVLTIHDLSVFDHPEWYAFGFRSWYRYLLPRLADRVGKVITDSEFSRGRILSLLGVAEGKVVVVPNGVGGDFRPPAQDRIARARNDYILPERYLLAIGSPLPRKNFVGLLRAWEKIKERLEGLWLVVVGRRVRIFRSVEYGRMPERVRLIERVREADLPAVYGGAQVFVYPTLYEGFGLPVLEAMACGVPVVASNRAALPEVVGDAGVLVNPEDAEGLARAVASLLADEERRAACIAGGLARAGRFSWERAAETVWEVLSEVGGRR